MAEGAADFGDRQHFAEETFARATKELPDAVRSRVSLRFAESSDAASTVCDYAEQHGFDIVAVGRHGTGGVLHPRLGHVAATAARRSSLPVLLVP
jgi:nucleotide-binding universal stress UspA family protein